MSNFPFENYFNASSEVEIRSKEAGFTGSWYLGTIIRMCKSKPEAFVEYKTLVDNNNQPLKERLQLSQLRPAQPPEQHEAPVFKIDDSVDAFYHSGWWEGIVTGIVEEEGSDGVKYVVFFRYSHEQRVFKASKLRVHREWVYGNWHPRASMVFGARMAVDQEGPLPLSCNMQELPSSRTLEQLPCEIQQSPLPTTTNNGNEFGFRVEQLVEVSMDGAGFEGAWFQATVMKRCHDGWYMVRYDNLMADDGETSLTEKVRCLHIRPRPPTIFVVERFNELEEIEALHEGDWWEGVISRVLKYGKYIVDFRAGDNGRFKHSQLRMHQEWKNGKWFIPTTKALEL